MDGSGALLVTGSTDGIVRMYDTATNQKIRQFNAHMEGGVGGVLYHKDGQVLVTCGRTDGNILDWDVRDRKYSSEESVHREWSTVVIVIVIFYDLIPL